MPRPVGRRALVAPPAPVPAPLTLVLDAEALLPWALGIARGVGDDAHLRCGSDQMHELEGTALVTLAKLMSRYDERRLPAGGDLVGHFKAMASRWIRGECRREAERLRNGGFYRTTSVEEEKGRRIDSLGNTRAGRQLAELLEAPLAGEPVLVEVEEEDEVDELLVVVAAREPRLTIFNSKTGESREL